MRWPLYGMTRLRPTNGYEGAPAAVSGRGGVDEDQAAAAASAIAFVQTKLVAGQSTDGAVFFPTEGNRSGRGDW